MVDKTVDIKQRFDRAKMAVDIVRVSLAKNIGLYDDKLREKELYADRLIDDFRSAIESNQFKVYYQPKFDIRCDTPVFTSVEALVRCQHPELGMISPTTFIPLFEENGLIQELDMFVWQTAAAQIRSWKDTLGFSVPVSVNVSRIDLYEPSLTSFLESTISTYGLTPDDLYLEITESAYTNDSTHIINKITELRSMGFRIEMDDFGVGYSSLSMVSTLPIDAIKLDMLFIRNAFKDGKDTRLLEIVIDIAGYLGVPVIAEGVETADQFHALKAIGCDIVQGFYFSRPLTADDIVPFLMQRKSQDAENSLA
jgi:EAL domain-containing protein (putative c-di-GMP-specific phosphodiesterase class I)